MDSNLTVKTVVSKWFVESLHAKNKKEIAREQKTKIKENLILLVI